jgi:YegS/Rv2252/BmrU family lipid kinase
MPASTLVVLNPASRSGATGRRWSAIETRLRAALGPLEVERTRGPRDAERIAREGVRAGVERIVVAGGDGTISEVSTGLLAADLASRVSIGLLPLGTGGDLVRTLETSRDLEASIARMARGKTTRIDAGRVWFRDRATGRENSTYFLNIASVGLSGLVTELVNQASKALGGRVSFFLGTLRGLARYRNVEVAIRVDGELLHEGPLLVGAAANGCFFGGGMRIAPRARLADGLLDAVVVPGVSKVRALSQIPSIYRGTHLELPEVRFRQGRCVEFLAAGDTAWIEIDGEPLGTLRARFEVIPGAITLFGVGE